MKKIHKVLIALLGVIVLAVVGFRAMQPKEPEYQGRKYSEWLIELASRDTNRKNAARAALRASHAKMLPFIESKLMSQPFRQDYSSIRWKISELQHEYQLGYHYTDRFFWEQSFGAMEAIGKEAVPTLVRLSERSTHFKSAMSTLTALNESDALIDLAKRGNTERRVMAIYYLGSKSDYSDSIIQVLIELMNDSNRKIVEAALYGLANKGPAAARIVPLMAPFLDSPDAWIRAQVAQTLGYFRADSVATLPKLKELQQDSSQEVQKAASRAINLINSSSQKAAVP